MISRMIRLAGLLLLIGVLSIGRTAAQPAPAPPAAPATAVDARRALDVLKDERRRAELIATLEAIAAAQTSSTSARPATPAEGLVKEALALPLAPDSLGANLLQGTAEMANRATMWLGGAVLLNGGVAQLAEWLWDVATNPGRRQLLLSVSWRLGLAFAAGWAAMWAARQGLRRLRARLVAQAQRIETHAATAALARAEEGESEAPIPTQPDTRIWRRLPCALGCLGLDWAAVLVFLATVHLLLATPIGGSRLIQLLVLAPLHGFALWQAVRGLGSMLSAPDHPALRLLPAGDEAAAFVQRHVSWLAGLVILGNALTHMAWLLGLPTGVEAALGRIILLIAHLGVAAIVLRQRAAVAAWLGTARATPGNAPPLRVWLAPIWHVLALVGVFVLWILLALERLGGPLHVLVMLLGSFAVLFLARGLGVAAGQALDKFDTRPAELVAPPDGTQRLHGWLRLTMRLLIGGLSALALLQIWGVPVLEWLFVTVLGRQMLGGLGTIGMTLTIAVVVWECANLAVNRHIVRLTEAARPGRAARLRTLLPMLRTALLVSILIMVGLTVLSQLGLNIAPLLAGAGVLGIAIGFGAQTLVRDVITGLFLLLENVMQVGDVVTLGGMSGVVEELSVRSIRLRAEDGAVHVVPFSAVTTVTNMTRDYGHAVIEARVAVTEDYERIVALLRKAFEEMRAEPLWATDLTGDLEVMGLFKLEETAMTIKCRLRCGPFARWRVLREFQRRMQQSFVAHDVRPSTTAVPVV